MRVPPELEHLLRESSGLERDSVRGDSAGGDSAAVSSFGPGSGSGGPPASGHLNCASAHLKAIEARKALEVENYLRACILRLEVPSVFDEQ